jgi:TrmH family RNA methyltransferase
MIISSLSNPQIKQLRQLSSRKERDRSGTFFIEGLRITAEAVQLGAEIVTLVVAPDLLNSDFGQRLVDEQRARGDAVLDVTPEVFKSISAKDGPQGLGAVVRQRYTPLAEVRPGDELGWIVLDAVQDPGNLGTILRTSDAVGAAGVILLGATTDPYDPAAVRASMGALFSQRLVKTSLAPLLAWKQQHGMQLVGTSDAATTDYQALDYQRPLLLFMGSERQGLSLEYQRSCDHMVSIPMVGRSDSLNLGVATGVMLYEIFSQQRRGGR